MFLDGTPTKFDPNPLLIDISPLDKDKKVVFDETALKTLNQKLTEKLKGSDSTNPNTLQYAKEFVGRMLEELARHDLVIIENIGEATEDHYAVAKKLHKDKK